MVKIFFRPGNTGKRMLSWVATERRSGGKSEDPTSRWRVKPSLKLDTLISRERQTYMPGLRSRRFEFATELVDVGKSWDPQRHARLSLDPLILRPDQKYMPRMILDPLIFRAYQVYTPREKLHRPLIFKDYLALKLGSKLYNFYKYRNGPGAPRENFAPGHIWGKNALCRRLCGLKLPGLNLHRPLIFEGNFALKQDDKAYKFYKSKYSRARDIRAARQARCGGYNAKLCLCQLIVSEYQEYTPRMILEPLILREYQVYTSGLKLHRPLIFKDYLALKLGSRLYNFYKYRNRPGAPRESKMILESLIFRMYKSYTPGLKLRKLFCALLERLNFGYLKEAMI